MLATEEPDPFEAKERDRIVEWYRVNDRFWYPFLYFQFWVGTRPSEAIALREADVDLERATVRISKSRDEGEESEPKTKQSRRTIRLYPHVVEVLKHYRPRRMHPKPDYFFTGRKGGPVYARDWAEDFGFYDVLARLKIRQRKFYATRHTSISWQLTQGANIFGVARYHGTNVQMIEDNYGKWIPEKGLDEAVLAALNRNLSRNPEAATAGLSTNPAAYQMRGGGLEPPRGPDRCVDDSSPKSAVSTPAADTYERKNPSPAVPEGSPEIPSEPLETGPGPVGRNDGEPRTRRSGSGPIQLSLDLEVQSGDDHARGGRRNRKTRSS